MLIEYVSIKLVWDIYIVTEIFNDIYIYIISLQHLCICSL